MYRVHPNSGSQLPLVSSGPRAHFVPLDQRDAVPSAEYVYIYIYWIHPNSMLSGWVNPHSEQQTIPQGQTLSPPKSSSRQRPKRAPIRRRLRRRQRRGEPHTEHGLGVLLAPLNFPFHFPQVRALTSYLSTNVAQFRPQNMSGLALRRLVQRCPIYTVSAKQV